MTFEPDAAQLQAVDRITDWYRDPRAEQVYRLFGFAGTGKTTLAQHLASALCPSGLVLYAAYSGKAANVLSRKGCHGASTIHRLIYTPQGKSREKIRELEEALEGATDPARVLDLTEELEAAKTEFHKPSFQLNQDSDLRRAKLLILDEVSMVNEYVARDLESFGVRILCLGDPAQLPPVKGEGHYTDSAADTLLTQIHRSALDSPVTRIATTVRQSTGDGRYGIDGMDGDSGRSADGVPLGEFDQILVGKNATRWAVISKVRKLAGNHGLPPQPGERILTLSNNSDCAVMNGEQFTILETDPNADREGHFYRLVVRTEDGWKRDLLVLRSGFTDVDGETEAKRAGWRGPLAAATYAHAITVHKAQGSQWDNVLVLDESKVFGRRDHDMGRRWFYTAVTRAAKRVVIRPAPVARGKY